MGVEAVLTAGVVLGLMGLLMFTRLPVDAVFVGALTLLLVAGVISADQALSGFSNEGLATVAVLYVVVAGLRDTGATQWLAARLLGRPRGEAGAQARVTLPVAGFSAFLNNTPVVAMMIPTISEWAGKFGLQRSKLLMPLSYAAILGGGCTIIGTSTTLIVNGYLLRDEVHEGLGFFEIAWVGLPVALAGLVLMLVAGRWLFPARESLSRQVRDAREYAVEMLVQGEGPLVGKTVEEAGLRHLAGSYLVEIDRRGDLIPAVAPDERLEADDRLVFVGVPDAVVELQKIRGLVPATDQVFKLDGPRAHRTMVEAVVSETCPLVGKTIREGRFRNRYDAVVIAVARGGRRLKEKPGDIRLRPGDALFLETRPGFADKYGFSRDFYLVSQIQDSSPPRHERALPAALILLGMVAAATTGLLSIFQAALLAAGAMLVMRCTTASVARRQVDWQILIVIGAAFGIGAALQETGLAQMVAGAVVGMAGGSPWGALLAVYVVTALFTAVITNNAAAVLMIPIALSAAQSLEVSFIPYAVTIMMAASASFMTPMGYQTNLMVYGPGGYQFNDYIKAGLPMTLLTGLVAVGVIPLVWGF
ncbi:SLC13 family permease [Natronospira bacteriovora]|uniref:SLC13 family permease n=1 Tax=Natronospira bacteriovora TaxID=3069753 RepID=A0ABU0W889_9GAMM|nr:SLC13 family permease [Natronospira sp. AB-CW4]MDQ2070139.1 SLC13 family permease [Natronospira sp. AB-CW4]